MTQVIRTVLLMFVAAGVTAAVIKMAGGGAASSESTASTQPAQGQAAAALADGIVVYYLHRTARCDTCQKLEAYTGESLKANFAAELASGRLTFCSVDFEQPPNQHLVGDYQLTANSVVLAEFRGGKQQRWKNLDRIWYLVQDRQTFVDYIRDETAAFMKGGA